MGHPGMPRINIRRLAVVAFRARRSSGTLLRMADTDSSRWLDRVVLEWHPPRRRGPRPRASGALPHLQLDQHPPAEIVQALLDCCLQLPHVRVQQSRLAAPEIQALALPDSVAQGPAEAFIDDHELCHLHPSPEGSAHLSLPGLISSRIVECGWAEPHPSVQAGFLRRPIFMAYAPRDTEESEVVLNLVKVAYQFAEGSFVAGRGAVIPRRWGNGNSR
jgi:hypothetical protein